MSATVKTSIVEDFSSIRSSISPFKIRSRIPLQRPCRHVVGLECFWVLMLCAGMPRARHLKGNPRKKCRVVRCALAHLPFSNPVSHDRGLSRFTPVRCCGRHGKIKSCRLPPGRLCENLPGSPMPQRNTRFRCGPGCSSRRWLAATATGRRLPPASCSLRSLA